MFLPFLQLITENDVQSVMMINENNLEVEDLGGPLNYPSLEISRIGKCVFIRSIVFCFMDSGSILVNQQCWFSCRGKKNFAALPCMVLHLPIVCDQLEENKKWLFFSMKMCIVLDLFAMESPLLLQMWILSQYYVDCLFTMPHRRK